jgi:hypothetical protein
MELPVEERKDAKPRRGSKFAPLVRDEVHVGQ